MAQLLNVFFQYSFHLPLLSTVMVMPVVVYFNKLTLKFRGINTHTDTHTEDVDKDYYISFVCLV